MFFWRGFNGIPHLRIRKWLCKPTCSIIAVVYVREKFEIQKQDALKFWKNLSKQQLNYIDWRN